MRLDVIAVAIVAGVFFTHSMHDTQECQPFPEAVAGWRLPFAVSVDDSVVSWQPNEYTAKADAIQIAYRNPEAQVRVASVTEIMWRRADGTTCRSTWTPAAQRTTHNEREE